MAWRSTETVGQTFNLEHEEVSATQTCIRCELIGDELSRENLRDAQDFSAGNAHEERDRVENVPKDELKSEMVNAEAVANPSQKTVDGSNK